MQNKVLLQRVKRLERKLAKENTRFFVFFSMPTKTQLAKLPERAKVVVFLDEDKISD